VRAVSARVSRASVRVDGEVAEKIDERRLLVLLGCTAEDGAGAGRGDGPQAARAAVPARRGVLPASRTAAGVSQLPSTETPQGRRVVVRRRRRIGGTGWCRTWWPG